MVKLYWGSEYRKHICHRCNKPYYGRSTALCLKCETGFDETAAHVQDGRRNERREGKRHLQAVKSPQGQADRGDQARDA